MTQLCKLFKQTQDFVGTFLTDVKYFSPNYLKKLSSILKGLLPSLKNNIFDQTMTSMNCFNASLAVYFFDKTFFKTMKGTFRNKNSCVIS